MVACNGSLAGMVCVCAGANVFESWAGFVVGLVGGIVYMTWSTALRKLKIDDPLDAASVRCAAWPLRVQLGIRWRVVGNCATV